MSLKKLAATMRTYALTAPTEVSLTDDKASFHHEGMVFRCLNSSDHITAMANRIEKGANKNYAHSKMPTVAKVRRESIMVLADRFMKDGDIYNVKQLMEIM